MRAKLAIIVLNYKTPELTTDCLASLVPQMREGVTVLVVDNASPDGSAEVIEQRIEQEGWAPWVQVLRSPVNGGFAAGNNLGLEELDAEAYLLLNSDTIVLPGAVEAWLEALVRYPDAGLIAPGVRRRGGERDDNTFRFPRPFTEFLRAAQTGPLSRLFPQYLTVLPLGDQEGRPDWVGFACVLIRREVIEQVGLLDDAFFMYFEDIDYCRRARKNGWDIVYWPHPCIVHLLGSSSQVTASKALRRRAPRFFYEARARYFAKHHGIQGLWLANGWWHLGRSLSWMREVLGNKEPHLREQEGCDIWINALRPLGEAGSRAGTRQQRVAGDHNQNPPELGFWALLREDFATYDHSLLEPGFWAVALHRFGNWRMDVRPKAVRAPLSLAYKTLFTTVNWLWGIDLCYSVKLGRRVRLWHHGGMVLGARSIGDDVHIRHNTTFGLLNRQELTNKPVIEDRVDIGAGACLAGDITVGHDSVIGANSVVLRDVPPHSTVLGVPARPVKLGSGPSAAPQKAPTTADRTGARASSEG